MTDAPARLQHFAVVTIVLLMVLVSSTALLLHRNTTGQIEHLGKRQQTYLSEGLATALAPVLLDVLREPRAHWPEGRLLALVAPALARAKVEKLKVYAPTGRVAYSTDADEIDEDQSANEGVIAALLGEVTVAVERQDTFNRSDGVMLDRNVLEVYVPLRHPDTGAIVGVFETYGDVTEMLSAMRRSERLMILMVLTAAAAAALLILTVYRRTVRDLRRVEARGRQHLMALQAARDDLETQVEARTSELRRSADELRKLSQAVHQSPNSIIVTDRDGVIEYVNPAFTESTGYDRDEAVGEGPRLLKSDVTPDAVYRDLWGTLSAGRTWRGELCNRRKDGTLYWDYVSISPIQQGDGVVSHYVAVQADVTAQKAYEESLRASEARVRAVMNGVTDAIVTIDTSGRIEQCNPAVDRLFGYLPEDLVGRQVEMLMPEPDRSRHAGYIRSFLEADPPRTIRVLRREVEGLHRGGARFPLELSVGEMCLVNERMFVGVMRDLTDRRQAEAELAATRQKYFHREKMAAVGQLAAGILHEVGNPVSAIRGAIDILYEAAHEPGGLATDNGRATLALIRAQVNRLETIGHDVARVTSPQVGEWALVDVNQLCRDATSLLHYDRRMAGIALELSLDPSIGAVSGSADQLIQVLLNLLLNATHACQAAGRDEPVVCVATRAAEVVVTLTVTDNGIGMDAQTRERACDAFFTTKPSHEGTGLGLSLSHSIVREHGGDLEVCSEPGVGTQVFVRLPLASDPVLGEGAW